jgi:hypothetical protein
MNKKQADAKKPLRVEAAFKMCHAVLVPVWKECGISSFLYDLWAMP